MTEPHPTPHATDLAPPRIIAWEVTRACPLACRHCRASARHAPYEGELSTDECRRLVENIASFARPLLILTGGEPMLRPDLYEIAGYAIGRGLPVALAPCGPRIDDEAARRMVEIGIRQISISVDGAAAASHDAFRGVPGAFEGTMRGIEAARRAGLPFQINTTVTRLNVGELGAILDWAVRVGATCFNPFLLVPTGRGKELEGQALSAEEYEETLRWLAGQEGRDDIGIRVTCAPHYQRILREEGVAPSADAPHGCLGGKAFAFISHRGKVQICGFLEVECGDVRATDFDFARIWRTSEVFRRVRRPDDYGGTCGACEYRRICGGCRARAFAATGDYLAAEPLCLYEPKAHR